MGLGSRVRVQVPKYGSRFPSTVMGWLNISDSYGMAIKMGQNSKLQFDPSETPNMAPCALPGVQIFCSIQGI